MHKRQFLVTLILLSTFFLAANAATAQDFGPAMVELQPIDMEGDNFKVSALLFGDAFTIQGHHLEDWDGESAWWTRRIYVTTDFANFGLGDTVVSGLDKLVHFVDFAFELEQYGQAQLLLFFQVFRETLGEFFGFGNKFIDAGVQLPGRLAGRASHVPQT